MTEQAKTAIAEFFASRKLKAFYLKTNAYGDVIYTVQMRFLVVQYVFDKTTGKFLRSYEA